MTKLFQEVFKKISSDEDLTSLCKEFSNYDPAYLCQSTYGLRKKTKDWMEKLWKQYEPYADKHFLEEFKHQFTQRSWELYLGSTFIERGFALDKHLDKGPDFKLININGIKTVWVEAIAVKKGTGNDKVPDMTYGVVCDIPTDQISLRLSSGLDEKYKKYISYIKDKVINDSDPYVIAIDRSECGLGDSMGPQILKVLFGIGDLALHMRVGGKPVENPERFWTHQPVIKKENDTTISMHFFDDPIHNGISAIIYCKDHVISNPRNPKEMGENFFIIHNPNAKNPLPQGFFPFGEEYISEGIYIKKIREKSVYNSPSPFEDIED